MGRGKWGGLWPAWTNRENGLEKLYKERTGILRAMECKIIPAVAAVTKRSRCRVQLTCYVGRAA
jgi:hypothetical protein